MGLAGKRTSGRRILHEPLALSLIGAGQFARCRFFTLCPRRAWYTKDSISGIPIRQKCSGKFRKKR